MDMHPGRWQSLLGLLAVLTASAAASCGTDSEGGGGSASCAAVVTYGGHDYLGHGELKRSPATTGRTEDAVLPGCDDGGGATDPEQVEVQELRNLPITDAVLVNGQLYLRTGFTLPAQEQEWFVSPDCAEQGTFEITGDWLDVNGGPEPRFDGDIRPPYRLEMRVTSGPEGYVGSTVTVAANAGTDPLLTSMDVKTSLLKGGAVTVQAHCAADRFVADALSSTPG